jgi:DNA polymerase V
MAAALRSQEAKDLSIKMGDPWFKIEPWAVKKGVQRFSSNYELYGDMSRRLFEVLQRVEPYSIEKCSSAWKGSVPM